MPQNFQDTQMDVLTLSFLSIASVHLISLSTPLVSPPYITEQKYPYFDLQVFSITPHQQCLEEQEEAFD